MVGVAALTRGEGRRAGAVTPGSGGSRRQIRGGRVRPLPVRRDGVGAGHYCLRVPNAIPGGKPPLQELPRLLRGGLYAYLLVAGGVGMVTLRGYSPLPTTALLDAWIVAFMAVAFLARRGHRVGLMLIIALYGLTRVLPVVLNDTPTQDFLQAYRWLLYLMAFVLAAGSTWGPIPPLRRVVTALIGMALVKATLSFILVGPGERPGLLVENNFEIALFCGLALVLYARLTAPQRFGILAMLAALMVLSGSRSGAVAFAVLVLYVLSQANATRATKWVAGAYAMPIVAAIPIWVFVERARTGTQIDRLKFLDVFMDETQRWDAITWLFGTEPLTPLSQSGCYRLSYYETLFASSGDGSCYSVILHAFVLRVVFDAGLVGLLIAFWIPLLAMRWAGAPVAATLGLLGIALTNSLSISGLNNPYVALPILLATLRVTAPLSRGGASRLAPAGAVVDEGEGGVLGGRPVRAPRKAQRGRVGHGRR